MSKHLVFVGAGHAHLTALSRLSEYIRRGHRVTVINTAPYHYYSGMGPGMLSGVYGPQDIRFNVRKMAGNRGAAFIEDSVVAVDPGKRVLRLKSGDESRYDVVSFNTGSGVPSDGLDPDRQDVFPVKPIINLLKARDRVLQASREKESSIVVVGGGPAGVEIAGNAWRLVKDNGGEAVITLVAGTELLKGFPERARRMVKASLESRGIIIRIARAEFGPNRTLRLSDGSAVSFDVAFLATGVRPSPLFRDSGLPTGSSGGLLVDRHLRSTAFPEVFGGGDCIDFEGRDLAKVGVYAVRENPVLFHNLLAAIEEEGMKEFRPQREYMLILNLGDGTGLVRRGNCVWTGKLAFRLKDYIDRKFMKTFQVSGEREEKVKMATGGVL